MGNTEEAGRLFHMLGKQDRREGKGIAHTFARGRSGGGRLINPPGARRTPGDGFA